MGESELVALVRSTNEHIGSLYGQIISINFAMVAAIFFFLNRASLPLKVLACVVYGIGMLMFWGLMLQEANMKMAGLEALKALPRAALSAPAVQAIELTDSWLGKATSIFLNAGFWALWAVILFLTFVWKRPSLEDRP